MFHDHRHEKFLIDAAELSCIERDAVKHWDMGLMRQTAEFERSRQIKGMLNRFGRYLGDLLESRHRVH